MNEENERYQTNIKAKELSREIEKFKGIEKIKQAEVERYKDQTDKLKIKLKEIESENDELMDKVH